MNRMTLPPSGTVDVLKFSRWSSAETSGPDTSFDLPDLSTTMVVAILIGLGGDQHFSLIGVTGGGTKHDVV